MAVVRPWRVKRREGWRVVLTRWVHAVLLAGGSVPTGAAGQRMVAQAGQERFEAFFRRFERDIFGYLWRLTSDEQAAYDLSQETFLRAWQHFSKILAYEQPAAWLFRVATNLALNYRRGRRAPGQTTYPLDEALLGGSDPAIRLALRDTVRRALMAVAPRQRAALVLREVYGLSCEEVAEVLEISPGAAKTILWRGRESFRDHYLREEGQ